MLSVGRIAEYSATTNTTAPKSSERTSETKNSSMASEHTDKFIKSDAAFTPAYTKATVTDNKAGTSREGKEADKNENYPAENTGKNEGTEATKGPDFSFKGNLRTKNELMRDMVSQMLTGQVNESKKNSILSELDEILKAYGAPDDVEEDYWGAEKTANRILDFAKSLAGDDPKALETLRKAFETGFGECEGIFGGKSKLPGVCYETYDLVQKGFDDWAAELSGAAEEIE